MATGISTATTGIYTIPISLNPFIQSPISLSGFMNDMYKADIDFYSNVTLTDVSDNTERYLEDLIAKKLSVVFFTTASSHIAGTLTLSDLKYTSRSKWSYNIPVENMLMASNGSISIFNQDTELYKFQELAMKILENRYNFTVSTIRSKLGLTVMEFLGANEKQWVDIVGIIADTVIKNRCEKLNLTPCYLAKLINKTLDEMRSFTLNEIDMHLYNTSILIHKLPAFLNTTLTSFYRTFNITLSQLAKMRSANISTVQTMGIKDLIQLFTVVTLQNFHLSLEDISKKYKKSQMDILVPCPNDWDSFEVIVVQEAFENEAKNMSITNMTLASLIGIPYSNVSTFSLKNMQQLQTATIWPVKEDKKMIELTNLFMLMNVHGPQIINSTADSAFTLIEAITSFTRSQLSLIYHWTYNDYQFSGMFSVADLVESCTLDVYNYSLLSLAELNVGNIGERSSCNSFAALRGIWDQNTVIELENVFASQGRHPINMTIQNILRSLTNASSKLIFRVLNVSSEVQNLCSNVSLYQISVQTSYSISFLKSISFQDLINLAVNLKQNGFLHHIPKVVST